MNKWWYFSSTGLLLIILCPIWTLAESGTLQHVKARGRLWVGVRMDSPPFGYVDGYGRNEGLDVDIAKQLAQELFGNPDLIDFKPVAPENEIRDLKAGEVDVVMAPTFASDERRSQIDYSAPYFVSGNLILERQDDSICSRDDLHGKIIATVKGADDAMVCDPAFGAACAVFAGVPQAVEAVREGRADVFVNDDVVLIDVAKNNRDLRIAGWQPFSVHHYCAEVRKGDKEWLGFIDAALTKMKKTSRYGSLLRKWFGMLRGLLYEYELSS